jgi:ligand-binding sensor domain-containing protein
MNRSCAKSFLVPLTCLLFLSFGCFGQEIPIGTWRLHISYNSIHSIAFGDNKIFAASANGIMVVDRSDNSVSSYNKINGLSSSGITSITFDDQRDQLIACYEDGTIDIIAGNMVINFKRLADSPVITGSKRLNSIQIRSDLAYITSDFGVVVFDLVRREVKETWRDLGAGGETLKIFQTAFQGDSIFIATEEGVMAGDLNDNLLDFSLWIRHDQGEFSGAVRSVAAFNEGIYAAIDNSGIHRYENGTWTKQTFLAGENFQTLNASGNILLIAQEENLWSLDTSDQLTAVTDDLITMPRTASRDENGKFWIGDNVNGLVSDFSGSFVSVLPNGPAATAWRLQFAGDSLFALAGGLSSSWQPLRLMGKSGAFTNGSWKNSSHSISDITDIDVTASGTSFISSFGYGVEKTESSGVSTLYDESNSTLVNLSSPDRFVNISAIASSDRGLWVANYGAAQSLHLLTNETTWQAFTFGNVPSRYPTDILVDTFGYVWMILNPTQGGGIMVFDPEENRQVYLTNVAGSGGLPSKSVRSIAIDRDGYVWVGTDEGVAYFIYPPDVFEPGIDAIKPIYENRFLLKDDRVTAIAVDGGNRKWMGTERGLWLFNPTGETLIFNFKVDNSPLLSDVIRDVEIVPNTGEIFVATDKGVASFRSGATSSESFFQSVKIFPNPVTLEFSGTVGISGLATDAIVKITDISGKLIWQTQANGGTATWNVQDYNGRRASTGIYLVFAATPDGSESVVGKLAVVE